MNYDLTPLISRLIPFQGDGGALAAVDVNFGPIMIRAKLFQTQRGYFLAWPSRKGGDENSEKWYDQVAIADFSLKLKAQEEAVKQYKKLSEGELVAV
jgi:DNA-binding cell septation regulator SpoVG